MRQNAAVDKDPVVVVVTELAPHALAQRRVKIEHLFLRPAVDDLV